MKHPGESAIGQLLQLGDLAQPLGIRAAVSLGIFDHLSAEPLTAVAIAERLGVNVNALTRLLNVLIASGVISKHNNGYTVTDVGLCLSNDHPLSMKHAFSLAVTELNAWSELEYCIQTGLSGFERAYGESHRTYRGKYLNEDVRMDRLHQAATRLESLSLSRAYSWADYPSVVDVGGGTGTLLAGLLSKYPNLRGILFDLPRMVVNARSILEQAGVSERCVIIGGDFFEEIPSGNDLYILKSVVGGWDDSSCRRIFASVRRAMGPDSRLLLIEPVMAGGGEFSRGNVVQLQSLVLYGGKDRTLEEYESLIQAAGLRISRVISRSTLPIIELVIAEVGES